MEIIILETDNHLEAAYKIFYKFEIGQSCLIKGWIRTEDTVLSKGELVLKEIERLDVLDNFKSQGVKGMRRRRVKLENCIGDFVAQKAFRYKKETIKSELRVQIWRIQ